MVGLVEERPDAKGRRRGTKGLKRGLELGEGAGVSVGELVRA